MELLRFRQGCAASINEQDTGMYLRLAQFMLPDYKDLVMRLRVVQDGNRDRTLLLTQHRASFYGVFRFLCEAGRATFVVTCVGLCGLFSNGTAHVLRNGYRHRHAINDRNLNEDRQFTVYGNDVTRTVARKRRYQGLLNIIPAVTRRGVFLVLLLGTITQVARFVGDVYATVHRLNEREGKRLST